MSARELAFAAALPSGDVQRLERLGTQSRSDVALLAQDGHRFVRKSAAQSGSNPNLRRQAIKQRLFAAQGFPFPAVRAIGKGADGRAYFDMDHVPSSTLAGLLAGGLPCPRAAVIDAVTQILWIFRSCVSGALAADAFLGAIAECRRACASAPVAADHRDAIAALATRLSRRDWSNIPASPAHGDLAPENILISAEQGVVFVDCDEAFASSYWLDFATLFSELACSDGDRGMLEGFADDLGSLAKEANARLPGRLAQLAALQKFLSLAQARSRADVETTLAAAQCMLDAA